MTDDGSRGLARRPVLRAFGASVVATGVTGCFSDGGNGDGAADTAADDGGTSGANNDSGDDAGSTPSESPERTPMGGDGTDSAGGFVREERGNVGRDDIPELEVVAWESEVENDEFDVRVAVRNDGDREADARRYTYQIRPYDESGSFLRRGATSHGPDRRRVRPGRHLRAGRHLGPGERVQDTGRRRRGHLQQ